MATTSFTQLNVWQTAHALTLDVYRVTRKFPAEERYGITSQIRRAAVSIGSNIAEGYGRRMPQDKARFYTISEGSTEEVKNLLMVSRDLDYLPEFVKLWDPAESVSRMLRRLVDTTLSRLPNAVLTQIFAPLPPNSRTPMP